MIKGYKIGIWILGLLWLVTGISINSAWADYIVLPANTVIGANDTTYDNASILIDGITATINGKHTFVDVEIRNSGKIITASGYKLDLSVNNITIDNNCIIDVTGKGYGGRYTLGDTTSGASSGPAGGSYGGKGAPGYYGGHVNNVYGDYRNPAEFGSGSGYNSAGGGLIQIVADSIILNGNGAIRANGVTIYGSGGGSGGGIQIDVGTLSGTGSITAVGGNESSRYHDYGGGGGGRIAVYYSDKSGYTGSILAYGGAGRNNGGAGTIYLKSASQDHGDLIVDNANRQTNEYSTLLRGIGTGVSDSIIYSDTTRQSILTNAGADWPVPDNSTGALGLKDLILNPNIDQSEPDVTFEVVDNTSTTITVNGDMTQVATAGDTYIGEYTFDNLSVINGAKLSTADNVYFQNLYTENGIFDANNIYQSGAGVIAPTLNPVATPTNTLSQVISGTKEPGTAIILNGVVVVLQNSQNTWSYEMPLVEGSNPINLYARNSDGLVSGGVFSEIINDTTAPHLGSSVPSDSAFANSMVTSINIQRCPVRKLHTG